MMNIPITMIVAGVLAALVGPLAADKESRCFEMRTYYAAPGKLDDLQARFRNHTVKLFEKHRITNIGYWVPRENPESKLVYLLAYSSRQAREDSWKAFMADPDWRAVVKATEAKGGLVSRVVSTFLTPTDYSPVVKPAKAEPARCFELRTYTASLGNLGNLNARFRDHTLALFAKHGLTSIGYWTPMPPAKNADDTLVYILAHPSLEAATEAWKKFRADPDWMAAKKASEVNGSLTSKVESLFLIPTDYSPLR